MRTAARVWVTIPKRMWSTVGVSRMRRQTWEFWAAPAWAPAERVIRPKRFRPLRGGPRSIWSRTGKVSRAEHERHHKDTKAQRNPMFLSVPLCLRVFVFTDFGPDRKSVV